MGIFQEEEAEAWISPAAPVVENPPPSAVDAGSSPVGELRSHMLRATLNPHMPQDSSHMTQWRSCMLQLRLNTAKHIVITIIKGQRERRKLGMLR